LSIDRTNWSFGSHHYNILTVGIVHEGVAIPILGVDAQEEKGNSNSDERMRTVTFLISAIILPTAVIVCLESAKVRII
jgi:hypothetical protein